MSNAERQAEFRRRLKARASLDALGSQAEKAAERAIEALWSFYSRPTPDGAKWGDTDDFANFDEFKAHIVEHGDLPDWCEGPLRHWEEIGATAEEAAAWRAVVDAANALLVKAKPRPRAKSARK